MFSIIKGQKTIKSTTDLSIRKTFLTIRLTNTQKDKYKGTVRFLSLWTLTVRIMSIESTGLSRMLAGERI